MSTETPLTDADVARLVALADAATPGPWEPSHRENLDWLSESDLVESTDHQPGSKVVFPIEGEERWFSSCWPHRNAEADAAFIAAANPATIKALAARLDALHAEVAALKRSAENRFVMFQSAQTEVDTLRAERDALRDAITALAGDWPAEQPWVRKSDLRALLSEAGEPNE